MKLKLSLSFTLEVDSTSQRKKRTKELIKKSSNNFRKEKEAFMPLIINVVHLTILIIQLITMS